MNIESLRNYCLSLAHATEDIKWDDYLCFCIAQKIFCLTSLSSHKIALKVAPENFNDLLAHDGIHQAPHFKKGQWIAIENIHAFADEVLKSYIDQSYQLVFQKLPKRIQNSILINPADIGFNPKA